MLFELLGNLGPGCQALNALLLHLLDTLNDIASKSLDDWQERSVP